MWFQYLPSSKPAMACEIHKYSTPLSLSAVLTYPSISYVILYALRCSYYNYTKYTTYLSLVCVLVIPVQF